IPSARPKPLLTKTQAVAPAILATLAAGGIVFVITASLPAALITGVITAIALAIFIHCKYKPAALPLPPSRPEQPAPPVAPLITQQQMFQLIDKPPVAPLIIQQQMFQLIDKAKNQCSVEDIAKWEQLIKEIGDHLLDPITEDNETVFHYLAKSGGPIEFVPLFYKKA